MQVDSSRRMRSSFLPFARPSLGEEEILEVVDTLRSGWITTGPKTERFAAEFLDYVGMTEQEFRERIDKARSPHLWEKSGDQWQLRRAVWMQEPGNA